MRLGKLDLNLLVALEVLLEERSVSIAAERLCLSQSAISSALGRLREYFGDELLVLRGRRMYLTSRAEELKGPVHAALEHIRSNIALANPFNPATCERQFRLMASDYAVQVLLAEALATIAVEAPNMRFEIQPVNGPVEAIERGAVDLLITIDHALAPGHPQQFLFEDDYVVIGSQCNPAMARPMTAELYLELGHVMPRFTSGQVAAFDDWFFRRQNRQRRIEVIAPSFLSIPALVIGTRRIATMYRRLAEQIVPTLPLVMQEVPFDIPPIREAIQWNIASDNEEALRWVVRRLDQIASAGPSRLEWPALRDPANELRLPKSDIEYQKDRLKN